MIESHDAVKKLMDSKKDNDDENCCNSFDVSFNPTWRTGKWTVEEEQYAEKLIEFFTSGQLILDQNDGRTLRSFLAKKLHCNPMRISKKFACLDGMGVRYQQQEYNRDRLFANQQLLVEFEKVYKLKDKSVQARRVKRRQYRQNSEDRAKIKSETCSDEKGLEEGQNSDSDCEKTCEKDGEKEIKATENAKCEVKREEIEEPRPPKISEDSPHHPTEKTESFPMCRMEPNQMAYGCLAMRMKARAAFPNIIAQPPPKFNPNPIPVTPQEIISAIARSSVRPIRPPIIPSKYRIRTGPNSNLHLNSIKDNYNNGIYHVSLPKEMLSEEVFCSINRVKSKQVINKPEPQNTKKDFVKLTLPYDSGHVHCIPALCNSSLKRKIESLPISYLPLSSDDDNNTHGDDGAVNHDNIYSSYDDDRKKRCKLSSEETTLVMITPNKTCCSSNSKMNLRTEIDQNQTCHKKQTDVSAAGAMLLLQAANLLDRGLDLGSIDNPNTLNSNNDEMMEAL